MFASSLLLFSSSLSLSAAFPRFEPDGGEGDGPEPKTSNKDVVPIQVLVLIIAGDGLTLTLNSSCCFTSNNKQRSHRITKVCERVVEVKEREGERRGGWGGGGDGGERICLNPI